MISAAKFFRETNEEEESNQEDRFSRWEKHSSTCWYVERPKRSSAPPGFAPAPAQQPSSTNGDWIVELESYLKAGATAERAAAKAGATATKAAANELRQNRHGLALSAPLRLCARTLTKTLLTPTPGGSFCIAGLSPGGTHSKPLEFFFYRHNSSSTPPTPEVPPGYEEVEVRRSLHEEKKDDHKDSSSTSQVYFLMEIQHRACRTSSKNTQTKATLNEIGLIWETDQQSNGDHQKENQPSYLSTTTSTNGKTNNYYSNLTKNNNSSTSTNCQGIRVKVIPSQILTRIHNQQQHPSADDLSWILSELEAAPPLTLPQPVGGGEVGSSLLLLVSLDPSAAKITSHNGFLRRNDQKTIHNGHLVLRFHRSEETHHPFSNQLSSADFCIGRQVQVVHHPSSQQEDAQRALQAALCNAERFIPEWKKKQWDNTADVLIMVLPHPTLPETIATWLRSPQIRRSQFDPAFPNVLLHLSQSHRWSPPQCYYVDQRGSVSPQVWNDIWFAHENISRIVANVKANATYHERLRNGDASIIDGQALNKLCVDLEAGYLNFHKSLRAKLDHCTGIELGYLSRMLTALMIERLRCFEDMKKHDMYSIHWKDHTVEIPPPLRPRVTCRGCMPSTQPKGTNSLCPYHLAQLHVQEETGRTPVPGKPIAIRTKRQLERLPVILWTMHPWESLVIKITVPGVAEDFPLVSIGDMVRLFFRSPAPPQQGGVSTEVVAEVVDVVVKTEVVTIRVPPPLNINPNGRPCTTRGCLPYLQALLHTADYFVDAQQVLNSPGMREAIPIQGPLRQTVMDQLRFDIRFGFQGGRGFDIIENVLKEFFAAETTRPPTPNKRKNQSNGVNGLLEDPQSRRSMHLHRLLAPTRRILGKEMVFQTDREDRIRKESRPPLNFVLPVNAEQKRAVEDIAYHYHGQAPYIIEGPAGTGKSMCVCEAIVQVLRTAPKPKVLVCAPSDAACDVLAARLLPLLPPQSLMRINWWSRKIGSIKPELLSSCPTDPMGGAFTIPSLEELTRADVIVCQCFVAELLELAGQKGWTQRHFTHLFIDETSQAMECEALVPMAKVGYDCSIVLAGDPKQLGPTVRDPVSAKMGLGVSIQERLLRLPLYSSGHYCNITRLVKNYRSNEALLTIPSSLFYGGKLECMAPNEVADPFSDLGDLGETGFPLLLCNVHNGLERSKLDTPSFYNMEECNAVVSLVQGLLLCRTKEGVPPLHTGQICVITPFRAQVLALRTMLRASGLGGVNVGVTEDFQGQETKVVLISTVLTRDHERWSRKGNNGDNSGQRLGFLHDPKKFCVAITRAHALCVIVGHAEYLEHSGTYWAALMDHIRRNDGVLGEEMDEEELGDESGEDMYGISELLRRVDELQLLGAGVEQDRHDLSYYYSDTPAWKVMLS